VFVASKGKLSISNSILQMQPEEVVIIYSIAEQHESYRCELHFPIISVIIDLQCIVENGIKELHFDINTIRNIDNTVINFAILLHSNKPAKGREQTYFDFVGTVNLCNLNNLIIYVCNRKNNLIGCNPYTLSEKNNGIYFK